MLPDFSRLALEPIREVPTDGFVWLGGEDEVLKFNQEHREGDPIYLQPYKVYKSVEDGGRLGDGWAFKVRNRVVSDDKTYGYSYYNAEALWRWMKINRAQPLTRELLWREDWWELHDFFDGDADAPAWIKSLPLLDPTKADPHTYQADPVEDHNSLLTDEELSDDEEYLRPPVWVREVNRHTIQI